MKYLKVLKVIYILLTGSIVSYYYGQVMPKDGIIQGIVYCLTAALIVVVYYLIYRWLFSRLEKRDV